MSNPTLADKVMESFPFEYIGGGYFREKGIPEGTTAKIIHGDIAIREAIRHTLLACDPDSADEIHP